MVMLVVSEMSQFHNKGSEILHLQLFMDSKINAYLCLYFKFVYNMPVLKSHSHAEKYMTQNTQYPKTIPA